MAGRLQAAARSTLGVSAAEFNAISRGCATTLANYAAAGAAQDTSAAGMRQSREQILTSGFATILAGLSPSAAANLTAYVNGPFRSSIRSTQVQGGAK